MKQEYLEVGKIVNTHGIHGELKIQPWCDSPEQLCEIDTLYIEGQAVQPLTRRIHKGCVLITLEGVDNMDKAILYKNKIVSAQRNQLTLPKGRFFNADLIGLTVIDAQTGETVGSITDVLIYPANNVLVVHGEQKDYLIPAVSAFIKDTNLDANTMTIRMIEGFAAHEN